MIKNFADRVKDSDAHLVVIGNGGVTVSLFLGRGPDLKAVGTIVDPATRGDKCIILRLRLTVT